jgi:hypothetical protein
MADGWICTCDWFDCADWDEITWGWSVVWCLCIGIPIVPLCTKYQKK